jgi:glutamate-1-semialdehyde 2,1-aminomutase
LFGTKPDITVFGKIIGGGYAPAAAVGARAEIMDRLAAGINAEAETKVKVGGTLSANHLTAMAGTMTIRELEKLNMYGDLDKAASKFMKALESITEKYDVPALLFNHGSILHVDLGGLHHLQYHMSPKDPGFQKHLMAAYMNMIEFSMGLAAEGLIISCGGKTYLCYDTIKVVEDAIDIYEKVISQYE